jgi:hypothetical protein
MVGLLGHGTPSVSDSTEASVSAGMMSCSFDIPSISTLVNPAEVEMVGMG